MQTFLLEDELWEIRMKKISLDESFELELETTPTYNFKLSVHKPAGWWWSTPAEKFENNTLWTATRHSERLVGLRLKFVESSENSKVCCAIFSEKKTDDLTKQAVKNMLRRALCLDEDLVPFYTMSKKDDILKFATRDLCGMHSVSWPELFPALILAVTLQMAPMKRSNQMMDLLISSFGEIACFDNQELSYWPSTKRVANTPITELESEGRLGYRAKALQTISKTLESGFPTMDELYSMTPDEAKKELMNLYGIGEYSAELIMPGMGFPLDVWSAKIFGLLLEGKVPTDPRREIPSLKKLAAARWGKWMGYAFVYVLNDLPLLSKRFGFDLTSF
jgi:DNA-3-methyladenine glycosylase II